MVWETRQIHTRIAKLTTMAMQGRNQKPEDQETVQKTKDVYIAY